MHILRLADYKRMPWKNGKGETAEIAVFPPDAPIDDFDWRISMATIAENGAFSAFEGTDRTLSVLSGEGIVLSVEGTDEVKLTPTSAPHAFKGERTATARLIGSEITDLNVMTNRLRKAHRVTRLTLAKDSLVWSNRNAKMIISLSSHRVEGAFGYLGRLDSLFLESGDAAILRSVRPAPVLLIEISDMSSWPDSVGQDVVFSFDKDFLDLK